MRFAPRARKWWARPVVAGTAVAVAALGTGIGVFFATQGPTPAQIQARLEAQQEARAAALRAAQQHLLSGVTVSPSPGATGVALDAPVSVTSAIGTLTNVSVTGPSGQALSGSLQGGKWAAPGPLQPSATYTIAATVVGGGVTATSTYTFTTLTPTALVTVKVFPTADMSVGVGQPIVFTFNHDITDANVRSAIESRYTVAESSPVPGGWYWFSPHEMHFRPQSYWPGHETITVTGNLDGLDMGSGRWGSGSVADSFGTSDVRISYANLQTEEMRVTLNGATVATYPISGGSDVYPTMDGDHIVMDRESVVHMVSSTVGIPVNSPAGYDEYVYDDVHISDSGEYVHAAPWSVASQGVTNVSHGCINLSPANASNFFGFSRVGDVVEVTGSPRPPVPGDHGVMDWATPWSDWTPANVVPISPPSTSTTAAPSTGPSSTTAPAAG